MVNSFKLFVESSNDRNKPQLRYFAFDWDDNILFMNTVIHMQEMVDGDWVDEDVSTQKFVDIRGKDGWRIQDNDDSKAYAEFRDTGPRGDKAFMQDTIESIKKKKFGPAWDDFIGALSSGSIISIITARGHEPDTIKKVCKWVIMNVLTNDQQTEMGASLMGYLSAFEDVDVLENRSFDEMVDYYLTFCDFYGITSDAFKKIYPGSSAEPEEAKKAALRLFTNKIAKFGEQVNGDVYLGFSDDDPGNVKEVTKLFRDELSLIHSMEYYIFDTSNKDMRRVHLEHLVTYESFGHGRDEIVFKKHFNSENSFFSGPIIGYKQDFESEKLGLMNGYQTGTVLIGGEEQEDRGTTDYSSPFHSGQVIDDGYFEESEELDFKYHRSINPDTIRKYLDEYVNTDYNDSKIIKIYYH